MAGKKRLYMTATERLYSEALKSSTDRVVVSMDDEEIYGKRFHLLSFKEAVENKLLTDFKVKIEMLPEDFIDRRGQQEMAKGSELQMEENTRLAAAWDAIARPDEGKGVLQRVIVFSNTIDKSVEFAGISNEEKGTFGRIVDVYNRMKRTGFKAETRHIDGTSKALDRRKQIRWLQDSEEDPNTCRILSNARCLSEGVDVPALDGIVFLESRKSKIDVVQSVGRVMRRAPGKETGYVILPVALPAGKPYHESLNDGKTFKVVWDVLRALRSHDESFAVEINRLILEHDKSKNLGKRIEAVTSGIKGKEELDLITGFFGQLRSALVREIGDTNYYDSYGKEIGKAAATIQGRITAGMRRDPKIKKAVEGFNRSLRRVVSGSIGERETVQVISQHMVLSRVFDRLFEGRFKSENPVAKEFEKVVHKLNMPDVTADLEDFYRQVDEEMDQVSSREGRQSFIKKIYGNFFTTADKKGAEKHGVVYTPIECIDFIINSVEGLLRDNFKKGLKTRGIKILEPFAGTGTFITRLLESGLIDRNMTQKYLEDISANELILLAHYVATINIETTYKSLAGDRYVPFPGMAYTDTLGMNPEHITKPEKSRRQSQIDRDLPELDKRVRRQMGRKIDVIIGNPPYSAGQKSFDDDNANIKYPDIDKRIRETYLKGLSKSNVNTIYDSYIRSIRWMSDRMEDCGVIGIITNGSFMRSDTTAGMRVSLVEEFHEIWCLDLRGNQRTKGEESRREGGKIFGSGSRAPVAILFLVKKKPLKDEEKKPATIRYMDVGDYLTAQEKIERLVEWGSVQNIEGWTIIEPDHHGDWLNQRNDEFYDYAPIGTKDVKAGRGGHALFSIYSRGNATARDVWAYNSSKTQLETNMETHIEYYNKMNTKNPKYDTSKGKWDSELTGKRIKHKEQNFAPDKVRVALYRPFFKQYLYFDSIFNTRRYVLPRIFPESDSKNLVICTTGKSAGMFSVIMADITPDLHLNGDTQCFPLYAYDGKSKKDNITDLMLAEYRTHYKDPRISKQDIFYYVYALLHHRGYRAKFANALTRELAHVPMAPDFVKFRDAGKMLADLHVGYETCKRHSLKAKFRPRRSFTRLSWSRRTVEEPHTNKTKTVKSKSVVDRTVVRLDGEVLYEGLPETQYEVNGRSPLGWVLDRYQVTRDEESGIINDPCTGVDICSIIERAIYVAVESDKIMTSLPEEFEPKNWKPKKGGLEQYV